MTDNFFEYRGVYRVQSNRTGVRSMVAGEWTSCNHSLDSAKINTALRLHPLWAGQAKVALRAARINQRTGAFLEGDALYYRQFFMPENGTDSLRHDILDIEKLAMHWAIRDAYLMDIFAEGLWGSLRSLVSDVRSVASNEYQCHEGGHALGKGIEVKYRGAYFRPAGKIIWPLVFMEEFRADLHGLGLALSLLPSDAAFRVFIYHIGHRLGLAALSARTGVHGAGAVPFLLASLLAREGFLNFVQDKGRLRIGLTATDGNTIRRVMRACNSFATRYLTLPEIQSDDLLGAAMDAAACWRSLRSDTRFTADYSRCIRG